MQLFAREGGREISRVHQASRESIKFLFILLANYTDPSILNNFGFFTPIRMCTRCFIQIHISSLNLERYLRKMFALSRIVGMKHWNLEIISNVTASQIIVIFRINIIFIRKIEI